MYTHEDRPIAKGFIFGIVLLLVGLGLFGSLLIGAARPTAPRETITSTCNRVYDPETGQIQSETCQVK